LFAETLEKLFAVMATGGTFGQYKTPLFGRAARACLYYGLSFVWLIPKDRRAF